MNRQSLLYYDGSIRYKIEDPDLSPYSKLQTLLRDFRPAFLVQPNYAYYCVLEGIKLEETSKFIYCLACSSLPNSRSQTSRWLHKLEETVLYKNNQDLKTIIIFYQTPSIQRAHPNTLIQDLVGRNSNFYGLFEGGQVGNGMNLSVFMNALFQRAGAVTENTCFLDPSKWHCLINEILKKANSIRIYRID